MCSQSCHDAHPPPCTVLHTSVCHLYQEVEKGLPATTRKPTESKFRQQRAPGRCAFTPVVCFGTGFHSRTFGRPEPYQWFRLGLPEAEILGMDFRVQLRITSYCHSEFLGTLYHIS